MSVRVEKNKNVIWNWDDRREQQQLKQLSLTIRQFWSGEINIREAKAMARPISHCLQKSERVKDKLKKFDKIIDKRKTFNALIKRGIAEDTPEALLRVVHSSSIASKFLQHAEKALKQAKGQNAELQVKFVTNSLSGTYNSLGDEIIILDSLPFMKKITVLLFELTNVIQHQDFDNVYQQAKGADDYALSKERIEFKGCEMTTNVLQQCIRVDGWICDKTLLRSIQWDSFEEYLRAQEEGGHTQSYRDAFLKYPPPQL